MGHLKTINFPFATNGKLKVLGVPILKHIRVFINEESPLCISCNKPITVMGLLISYIEFGQIRAKYFNAQTVKELFNDLSNDKIINFLKEINFFLQIVISIFMF